MKVFVTGGTGHVGTRIIPNLVSHGHQVLALARSDKSAEVVKKLGGEPLKGDVENLESLKKGSEWADGIIHAGFIHDFSDFYNSCLKDKAAIEAMGSAIKGTNKPILITSGTLNTPYRPGQSATEDLAGNDHNPRNMSEKASAALAEQGIKSMVMRLAPTVHGPGDGAFIPYLIDVAKKTGVAGYVDDGESRWPAVNVEDAANAYRLALENGKAGDRYHIVEGADYKAKDIAAHIGKHVNVPVQSIPKEKAQEHFGWISFFYGVDNPTSSEYTRKTLKWEPKELGLFEDMEKNYFVEGAKSKF